LPAAVTAVTPLSGAVRLPAGPWQHRVHQTLGWYYRPLPFLERCRARYGDRFTLRLIGVPPVVVLSSPDDVRAVLTGDPDVLLPGSGADLLEPIVGPRSIALMDGEEHLTERRLLLPALHGERVQRMAETMRTVAAAAIERWPADEPVALHPLLQRLSLDVVMEEMLGIADDDPRRLPLRDGIEATLAWSARLTNLMTRTRRSVLGRGPWARLLEARDRTDRLLFDLIAARRDAGEGEDLLGGLLAARYEDGSRMSDRQIRDELLTLVAGGHESIALSLAWTCAHLARTPKALRRLVEEIDTGAGDAYLTATIQEALRHRPVLPIFPRRVAREVTIGAHRYPAGVLLQADAYLLHHDPAVYPDPYAFRPERFLQQPPGTYTWVPFGGGRRRCLGSAFAAMEMKEILRALLSTRTLVAPGAGERTRRHSIGLAPGSGARLVLARV
jgi:cytochrome P450